MVDMVAACKAVSLQPKHPKQIAVSDGRPIALSIELPLAAPQISLYKNEYTEMMAWYSLGARRAYRQRTSPSALARSPRSILAPRCKAPGSRASSHSM